MLFWVRNFSTNRLANLAQALKPLRAAGRILPRLPFYGHLTGTKQIGTHTDKGRACRYRRLEIS